MKKSSNFWTKKNQAIIGIILLILVAISSFIFTNTTVLEPISDEEYKYLENVAKDVYIQGNQAIYDIPDDVKLEIEEHYLIKIQFQDGSKRGEVRATVTDGILNFHHEKHTVAMLFVNFLIFCLGVVVLFAIYLAIEDGLIPIPGWEKEKVLKKDD